MKAEINNENKARFFAIYWNQDVLSSSMYGDGGNIYSLTMKEDSHENKWLSLKPLSQISDEDKEYLLSFVDKIIQVSETYATGFGIDFLRSKGYAVPWMGLSVEEMIESGWIKLGNKYPRFT